MALKFSWPVFGLLFIYQQSIECTWKSMSWLNDHIKVIDSYARNPCSISTEKLQGWYCSRHLATTAPMLQRDTFQSYLTGRRVWALEEERHNINRCLKYAKRSFHHAANTIFEKLGKATAEYVDYSNSLKENAIAILLYGLETSKRWSQVTTLCHRPFIYETIQD